MKPWGQSERNRQGGRASAKAAPMRVKPSRRSMEQQVKLVEVSMDLEVTQGILADNDVIVPAILFFVLIDGIATH